MDGRIPARYQTAEYSELPRGIRDELRGWELEGVLLSGPNGIGKTYAACAIARRAFRRGAWRHFPAFVAAADIPVFLTPFPEEWDDFREQTAKTTLYQTECLILDDLGKEERSSQYKEESAVARLGNLLRTRTQHGLTTLITTNLKLDAIAKTYGKSIASIVRELCPVQLEMRGADRR